MGVLKIDYNRGVLKKVIATTGMEIFMYIDTPGVYYTSYETEVTDELAAKAGYDIGKLGKLRKRRELAALALQAIDADLDMEEDAGTREVIEQRGGFALVHIGLGRHILEDPEGGKLVDRHMTLEEGQKALEELVPSKPQPLPVDLKAPKKDKAS